MSRIRPMTDKLRAARKAYNARVKEWLVGKRCAVFPTLKATQCHHKFGRIGRLLLWEPGWIPVSEAGHDYIHKNPAMARALGFFGPLGTWNDYDRAVKLTERKTT